MSTTDYSNNKAISPDYSYLTGYFDNPADTVENLPQVMPNSVSHGVSSSLSSHIHTHTLDLFHALTKKNLIRRKYLYESTN